MPHPLSQCSPRTDLLALANHSAGSRRTCSPPSRTTSCPRAGAGRLSEMHSLHWRYPCFPSIGFSGSPWHWSRGTGSVSLSCRPPCPFLRFPVPQLLVPVFPAGFHHILHDRPLRGMRIPPGARHLFSQLFFVHCVLSLVSRPFPDCPFTLPGCRVLTSLFFTYFSFFF